MTPSKDLALAEQPVLQLVADLEEAGAMDAVSLTLDTKEPLPFDTWYALGRFLGRVDRSARWWIGDWLNFGEAAYGQEAAQAVEATTAERWDEAERVTGLAHDTLLNICRICSLVPRSRRRPELSFSLHEPVAALEPDEQTRWLDAATENRLSVSELRAAIKDAHPAEPREQPQWSSDAPPSYDPLPSTAVVEAAERAEAALSRPLPEGHPLWRSQAEEFARDVISLARTVDPAPDGLVEKVTCPNCGAEFEG